MMDRKGGPFSWPPHLPDFSSLDFLWRHVKTVVCATKPSLLQDLKVKIINVISGITVNQLANVFCELRNCITLCIANDGGNVETNKISLRP